MHPPVGRTFRSERNQNKFAPQPGVVFAAVSTYCVALHTVDCVHTRSVDAVGALTSNSVVALQPEKKKPIRSSVSGGQFDFVWLPASYESVPHGGPRHVWSEPNEIKENTRPENLNRSLCWPVTGKHARSVVAVGPAGEYSRPARPASQAWTAWHRASVALVACSTANSLRSVPPSQEEAVLYREQWAAGPPTSRQSPACVSATQRSRGHAPAAYSPHGGTVLAGMHRSVAPASKTQRLPARPHLRAPSYSRHGAGEPAAWQCAAFVSYLSRSIPPPWRSIRFRLALRTYAPWGVRVVSQTKSRKIPTRKILTLFFETRTHSRRGRGGRVWRSRPGRRGRGTPTRGSPPPPARPTCRTGPTRTERSQRGRRNPGLFRRIRARRASWPRRCRRSPHRCSARTAAVLLWASTAPAWLRLRPRGGTCSGLRTVCWHGRRCPRTRSTAPPCGGRPGTGCTWRTWCLQKNKKDAQFLVSGGHVGVVRISARTEALAWRSR